jgi:hypothetical protein
MSEKIGYIVKFDSNQELIKMMQFLFGKGLVFTDNRIRTIDKAIQTYNDWFSWNYIIFNHRECKRVMNSTVYNSDSWCGTYLKHISLEFFLKEILPSL